MSDTKKMLIASVSAFGLIVALPAIAGQMGEKQAAETAPAQAAEEVAQETQSAMVDTAPEPDETIEAVEMSDSAVETAEAELNALAPSDIIDTAIAAEGFNTLVAAIEAAGLVEVLKGEGPFTVFAPTDEAFAALPDGTLDSLLQPENKDQLAKILTYHVLSGKVLSTDLAGEIMVPSVEGNELKIAASDAGVTVDNASVITADIEASNGVIHVIDKVVLPADIVL